MRNCIFSVLGKGWLQKLQRVLNVIWPIICDGCHLMRATEDDIRKAGFKKVECFRFDAKVGLHVILRLTIIGYAEV